MSLSDAVLSLLTFGLFAATVGLVVVTFYLWLETKRIRIARETSNVVVGIEPSPSHTGAMIFVIENVGDGVAKNITVRRKVPSAIQVDEHDKSAYSEIDVLKPRQRIESFVDMFWSMKDRQFEWEVAWEDTGRGRRSETAKTNISNFEWLTRLGKDPLISVAESAATIADVLKAARSSTRRGLTVDIYTNEDRQREAREFEERREARRHPEGASTRAQSDEVAPEEPRPI